MEKLKKNLRFSKIIKMLLILIILLSSIILFPTSSVVKAEGTDDKPTPIPTYSTPPEDYVPNTRYVTSRARSIVPEKYSLRDEYMIFTENQDSQGLCWDFASIKALSTTIMKATGEWVDFSEGWISNALYYDSLTESSPIKTNYSAGGGGNIPNFNKVIEKYGILLEQDYPYEKSYNLTKENCEVFYDFYSQYADKDIYQSVEYVNYMSWNSGWVYNIDEAKNHLINYGALYTSYVYFDEDYTTISGKDIWYKTSNEVSGTAHAVTIIGWDDNITLPGFSKGAWIILNSWGNDFNEDDGIFYIAYDDTHMQELAGFVYTGDSTGAYLNTILQDSTASYTTEQAGAYYLTGSSFVTTTSETKQKNIFYGMEGEELSLTYSYSISSSTTLESIEIYRDGADVTSDFITKVDTNNQKITITDRDTTRADGNYKVVTKYKQSSTTYTKNNYFLVTNGTGINYALVYAIDYATSGLVGVRNHVYSLFNSYVNEETIVLLPVESSNYTINLDFASATYSDIESVTVDTSTTNYKVPTEEECGNYYVTIQTRDDFTITFTSTSGGTKTIYVDFVSATKYVDVYYDFGGGEKTQEFKDTIAYPSTSTEKYIVEIPNRDTENGCYTFAGWYLDSEFSEPLSTASSQYYFTQSDIILDSSPTYSAYLYSANLYSYTAYIILYAKWEENTYTIKYDTNIDTDDGKHWVYYETYVSGASRHDPDISTLSVADKVFNGYWYTTSACSTKWSASTVTTNKTVYAEWVNREFTITYYKDKDKSATYKTVTYETGETISSYTPTASTGYEFVEWRNVDDDTPFTDTVMGTENIEVYPYFKLKTYVLTLIHNGTTLTTLDVEYGTYVKDFLDAYTFSDGKTIAQYIEGKYLEGYYTNSSCSTSLSSTKKMTSNYTVYLSYTDESYSVVYDYNYSTLIGSETEPSQEIITYDFGETLANPTGSRTGHTFTGWYYDEECTTKWDSTTMPDIGGNGESITVYAGWEIETFDISVSWSGGFGRVFRPIIIAMSLEPLSGYTETGSFVEQENYFEEVSYTIQAHEGYHIVSYSGFVSASYSDENTTEVLVETGNITSDLNLTVIFAPNTDTEYTVYHWKENLSGSYEEVEGDRQTLSGTTAQVTNAVANSYEGFTVQTFSQSEINYDGSTEINIYYSRNTYTLTLSKGEGISTINPTSTTISIKFQKYYTVSATVLSGYDFDKWVCEGDILSGSSNSSYSFYMPASDITLTATAKAKEYSIIYYGYYADGTDYVVNNIPFGSILSEPTEAKGEREGYTFEGYYTDNSYSTLWEIPDTMPASNLQVYCLWEANSYSITYNFNYGTIISSMNEVEPSPYEKGYNYGETIEEFSPTRAGHNFLGWFMEEACTNAWVKPSTMPELTNVGDTIEVYAKWEILSYLVSASTNGYGEVTPSSSNVTYGGSVTFTISPNSHYHITNVTVDGSDVSDLEGIINSNQLTLTNVADSHEIYVAFAIDTYVITASSGIQGSIAPSGESVCNWNTSKTFTFTPSTGYYVSSVLIDGVALGETELSSAIANGYTFSNISDNHTIAVEFEILTFSVTISVNNSNYGSASIVDTDQNADGTFNYGTEIEIYININNGYKISSVEVSGVEVEVGDVSGYYVVVPSLTKNEAIVVNFEPRDDISYTVVHYLESINSSDNRVEINGTYYVMKEIEYSQGSTGEQTNAVAKSYTGFYVADTYNTTITADGNAESYICYNRNTYSITIVNQYTSITTVSGNGNYKFGASAELNVQILDQGYSFVSWTSSDETLQASGNNASYMFEMPAGNLTFTLSLKKNAYSITFVAFDNNGQADKVITGIEYQSSVKDIMPADPVRIGHTFGGYFSDDTNLSAWNSDITMPNHNLTIYVKWDINSYTITYIFGYESLRGYEELETKPALFQTTSQEYDSQISPPEVSFEGYQFNSWLYDDGSKFESGDKVGVTDLTLTATWTINTYTVVLQAGNNGKITGKNETQDVTFDSTNTSSITIEYMDSLTFVILADTNYHITEIKVDLTSYNQYITGGAYVPQVCPSNTAYFTLDKVKTDKEITASFAINYFYITSTAGDNGSIDPAGQTQVNMFDSITFNFVANTGYHVSEIIVNEKALQTEELNDAIANGYTFESVDCNNEITVNFEINTYIIKVIQPIDGKGNITNQTSENTPNNIYTYKYGDSVEFKITSVLGYHIENIYINSVTAVVVGSETNRITECDYIIDFVDKNIELSVNIVLNPTRNYTVYHWLHSISSTSNEYKGTYYTLKTQQAVSGIVDTYTQAVANTYSGYHLLEEISQQVINYNGTTTINIYYFRNTYTLTLIYNTGIDGVGVSSSTNYQGKEGDVYRVLYGEAVTLKVTLHEGYLWSNWQSSNTSKVKNSTRQNYSFAMPDTDLSMTASASIQYFECVFDTSSIEEFAEVEVSSYKDVAYNTDYTYSINCKTGYEIAQVYINGEGVGKDATNTIKVTEDTLITVEFAKVKYDLQVSVGDNGTASFVGEAKLEYLSDYQIDITPNEGYGIKQILVNGEEVEITSNLSIADISSNVQVEITFGKLFRVTTSSDNHGTITPSLYVVDGDSKLILFYPNEGYEVDKVTVNGTDYSNITQYKLDNVGQDYQVSVTYKIRILTIDLQKEGEGDVSLAGTDKVEYGQSRTISVTPKKGNEVHKVYVNGKSYECVDGTVIIEEIKEDLLIKVIFTPIINESETINWTIYIIIGVGIIAVAGIVILIVRPWKKRW